MADGNSSERDERCENCRFWEELPSGHQQFTEKGCEGGYCRRYPPVLNVPYLQLKMSEDPDTDEVYLEQSWSWPVTAKQEWCGEWQRKKHEPLDRSIETLGLPKRVVTALIFRWPYGGTRCKDSIQTIGDLIECSRADLLELRNIGTISVAEIEAALSRLDLALRQD